METGRPDALADHDKAVIVAVDRRRNDERAPQEDPYRDSGDGFGSRSFATCPPPSSVISSRYMRVAAPLSSGRTF